MTYFQGGEAADIPVMLTIGFLGALISNGLHDKFRSFHDDTWNGKTFSHGGHAGEIADEMVEGPFLHRLKYGHDLFNPGEIRWDEYFSKGEARASIVKKVFAWLRHLLQDTCSTEGLPIPGHSYLRDAIIGEMLPFLKGKLDMTQHEVYKTFFTLKMRDLAGAAFIPLAMTAYVYGTEKGNKNKFFNYRYTSLTIGALAVSIPIGLMMPHKSFNYSSIAAMIPYVITLFKVNQRINEQLTARDSVLKKNDRSLFENELILQRSYHTLNENDQKLLIVRNNLQEISKQSAISLESCMKDINLLLKSQENYLETLEKQYGIVGGI